MPPTNRRATSWPRALARGLFALVFLVLLVAGIPVLLLDIGTLPRSVPDVGSWQDVLQFHDDDGTALMTAMTAVAWVLWLWLTVPVVIETIAVLARRTTPRLPGMGTGQKLAGFLLGSIILASPQQPAPQPRPPPQPPRHCPPRLLAQMLPVRPARRPAPPSRHGSPGGSRSPRTPPGGSCPNSSWATVPTSSSSSALTRTSHPPTASSRPARHCASQPTLPGPPHRHRRTIRSPTRPLPHRPSTGPARRSTGSSPGTTCGTSRTKSSVTPPAIRKSSRRTRT